MGESVASVAAFYVLARAMFTDRWTVILATVAFALVPRSFIWLIMGGGLTRALALTLALLAFHQARKACEENRWAPAIRASVLLSLTVLTTLGTRSEEHTSELQSLMRISYAVFCLKKKKNK